MLAANIYSSLVFVLLILLFWLKIDITYLKNKNADRSKSENKSRKEELTALDINNKRKTSSISVLS